MKLVKLSASWCGPCKDLAKQLEVKNIKVTEIDVDVDKELAKKHGVRSVPTILVMNGDELVEKFTGTRFTPDEWNRLQGYSND